MRPRRPSWNLLLIAGLLVGSSSFWLRHFFPLADWATGCLMGVGLGLELLALRKAIRPRTPTC